MADIPKANEIKQEVEKAILRADDGEVGAIIQNRNFIITSVASIKEKLRALRTNLDDWLADVNLAAENIKNGVTIFGLTGTFPNDGTAQPSEVLTGKTFYNNSATKRAGTMPDRGAVVITPSTTNQVIVAGYHNGSGYVKGDANLVVENIRSGVSIFGVTGTAVPYKEAEGSVRVPNTDPITVTGLAFTPKVVFIRYRRDGSTMNYVCAYTAAVGSSSAHIIKWYREPTGALLDDQNPSFSVSSGQFSFRVPHSSFVPGTAYWKAYGT